VGEQGTSAGRGSLKHRFCNRSRILCKGDSALKVLQAANFISEVAGDNSCHKEKAEMIVPTAPRNRLDKGQKNRKKRKKKRAAIVEGSGPRAGHKHPIRIR